MRACVFVFGSLLIASCSNTDTPLDGVSVTTQAQQLSVNSSRINWLNGLRFSEKITPFTVTMRTPNGEEVTALSQLHPDTDYSLIIKGEELSQYELKVTNGFYTVLQNQHLHRLTEDTEFVIPIHTKADLTSPIYVSVVPVHAQGNHFSKEKPKSFLLPIEQVKN